jgi:glycosyltransferase involved in cell wall biosynthesis
VSLAVPVVSLLRNPDQARILGEAGRKLVETRYNIAKVAARHEELYDEILTRKNSRATGWFARI